MRLKALALATAVWGAAGAVQAQSVVVVRHAEKVDASRDPVLSDAGGERARALAAHFGSDGPDLILVSPLQRTGLTAAPTAAAFGAPVQVMSLEAGTEAHVASIVAAVRAQPADTVVLVVGHSNTVPLILRALDGGAADMADCEYDRLTRIDLNATPPSTIVSRYGAPSTC